MNCPAKRGFFLLLLAAFAVSSVAQQKDLSKIVEELNFESFEPPRTGTGPGTIYTVAKDEQGRNQSDVICADIFEHSAIKISEERWAATDRTSSTSFTLGGVLGFLGKAVGFVTNGDGEIAGASVTSSKTVSVEFSDLKLLSVPLEDRMELQLSDSCLRAMRWHKERDKKLENLFVVSKTLSADAVTVESGRTGGANADAVVPLNTILKVAPTASIKWESSNKLGGKMPTRVNLGYSSVRIKDYLKQAGTVSGANAVITLDLTE